MPDGKMSDNTIFGTVTKFLGVYSGRLTNSELEESYEDEISEIGKVWKASVLDAITQQGLPGTCLNDLAR